MLRSSGPLTKGVSFQAPTTLLTKPNEANLRTVINAQTTNINSHNLPTIKEADSLVSCVYKFTKRARRMVDDIRTSFPVSTLFELLLLIPNNSSIMNIECSYLIKPEMGII